MFGRNKPVVFERHSFGRRPSRFHIPRWLLILLLGIVIGAGGLWTIQEQYLPPRLSQLESSELRAKVETAERERDRMSQDLKQANERQASAEADSRKAQAESAAAKQTAERLQKDMSQFVLALPPDPRGGPIGVRAAALTPEGTQLNYHVIFTRVRKGDDSFKGAMQLVVSGFRKGRAETVPLAAVPLTIDTYQHLSGSLALPEGMVAREVTVRVLRGGAGGEMQAMRVFRL